MIFKTMAFIAVFSFNTHANEIWAIDCSAGKGYITFKDSKVDMVVNSNQIVISADVIKNDDKLAFFLDEPIDLGRGGMMLDWDSFSSKKAIAEAVVREHKIIFSWRGFFDKNTSKYLWVSDADFSSPTVNSAVTLTKCE
ncbi:hypothetical protein [Aeromonas enteropelogenes]|uniref:hypothetical protein n=1 Tax=Aeromonas enteropelogenes TaxID=29489 RepID=UPI000F53C1EF|nr:hypothetical protein [Aeromonas enteropelogenes]RQM70677.1 hypothetical protein EHZ64_00965 [Aeromonas enteropelogenes]